MILNTPAAESVKKKALSVAADGIPYSSSSLRKENISCAPAYPEK